MNTHKQFLLVVLDGWGYKADKKYNAIAEANPQFMNHLWETYPHALLKASGEAVGLPEGTIGTSEIGHLTIGAGRTLYTDMIRVNKAIQENTLKDNEAFQKLFDHVKKFDSTLHVMGLVSPGGVHSHQEHLFAFLRLAANEGIKKIAVHVFTDGRDTPPQSGSKFIMELQNVLTEIGVGRIATISGRYFAMDRDTNWDRTQKALDALFEGFGEQHTNTSASQIIEGQYKKDIGDEFIPPQVLLGDEGNPSRIQINDGIFFFNFRPDRARQITSKILEKAEEMNLLFVSLAEYDKTLKTVVAFPPISLTHTLSDIIAEQGMSQVHIAETEKYAHVTYFFNGGNEKEHKNEEFVLIDSRKDIPTHDLAPEMRAKEIADKTLEYIEKGIDFIVINFANADMVGHTGKWEPAVAAIKAEDAQIKRVVEAVLSRGGVAAITADHGNAEVMFDESTGHPQTSHSLEPVPFIITNKDIKMKESGTLADVAPTLLNVMQLPKPKEMTGTDLIIK